MVIVEINETKKAIVHDTLEYEFEALMQEFVADEEVSGGDFKQRVLVWAQGIVMWITYISRPTNDIVNDEVNGTLHFQRVTYAIKEKFEKRIVRGNVTINLLDQDEIPLYRDLAKELKRYSQWKEGINHVPESYGGNTYEAGDPEFVQNLQVIEKEIGIPNDEEYEFIKAGYNLELPVQLTADLLKKRRYIAGESEPEPVAEPEPVTKPETKKSSIRYSGSGTDEKLRS
tara:strand:+ start:129 stop:815 length:687 start_codon:yes stop_codon:yes gene_type:complete